MSAPFDPIYLCWHKFIDQPPDLYPITEKKNTTNSLFISYSLIVNRWAVGVVLPSCGAKLLKVTRHLWDEQFRPPRGTQGRGVGN